MRTLALAALFAFAFSAQAHAQSKRKYDVTVKNAVAEYAAGNWGEARVLFARAHEMAPSARTFRGLGLCDFELRRYVEAITELEAALADQRKPLTSAQRQETQTALERAREYVAVFELSVPAGVTEMTLDGATRPLPGDGKLALNPGLHRVVVRPQDGDPIAREVDVQAGARGTIAFEPERPAAAEPGSMPAAPFPAEETRQATAAQPQGSGPLLWTWVAGGATVAFGAATVVFALLTQDKVDAFDDVKFADPVQAASLRDDGQTYQLLTNVGVGVTAAAAVGTVVLYFVESSEPPQEKKIEALVGPGSVGVRGRF